LKQFKEEVENHEKMMNEEFEKKEEKLNEEVQLLEEEKNELEEEVAKHEEEQARMSGVINQLQEEYSKNALLLDRVYMELEDVSSITKRFGTTIQEVSSQPLTSGGVSTISSIYSYGSRAMSPTKRSTRFVVHKNIDKEPSEEDGEKESVNESLNTSLFSRGDENLKFSNPITELFWNIPPLTPIKLTLSTFLAPPPPPSQTQQPSFVGQSPFLDKPFLPGLQDFSSPLGSSPPHPSSQLQRRSVNTSSRLVSLSTPPKIGKQVGITVLNTPPLNELSNLNDSFTKSTKARNAFGDSFVFESPPSGINRGGI
jgi:hypothetical protein